MKLTLLALALSFTSTLALRSAEETAALALECGDLGVMEVPEGADPSTIRHCAGHPLGDSKNKFPPHSNDPSEVSKRANSAALKGAEIFGRDKMACEWGSKGGCSGGYCWKSCGNAGEWCWTAAGDGGGNWLQCRSYNDCNSNANCGKGCKPGNGSCGCSC